jgi:hypothetical protein
MIASYAQAVLLQWFVVVMLMIRFFRAEVIPWNLGFRE